MVKTDWETVQNSQEWSESFKHTNLLSAQGPLLIDKKVWKTETKPTTWKKTMCHQLYKGKGEKKDFCNQRFIHTKEDVPKGFEQIVINKSKPQMVQNCTKFQIGAIPGHQPSEHLFTIKSIISFFRSSNHVLFLQCFDIKKYFDSENLKQGGGNKGAQPLFICLST